MPSGRDPNSALEIRRNEILRIEQSGAQYFKVSGEVEVVGPGEASVSVGFPVLFSDKPAFSFGPQLNPGTLVVIGNIPTCSVVLLVWHERIRDDGSVMYVGAQLGIVSTGPTEQVMLVQWHVEGVALNGPVDSDEADDEDDE